MGRKRKNEIVKKSNALIRSHWTITSIWEPRIVALIASKIRVEDSDFQTYRVYVSELIEGTGQKRSGRIYDEIEGAIKKVMQKTIEVQGEKPHQKILYSLFSMCLIDEKDGYLEVRFDADLKPHFLDLKERFTQYSLEEFMRLPSTYSQRLFEVLSSWRNAKDGEVSIAMDELHRQMDSPPSQRKNFTEFRERVLEQAQKDIMSNPDSSLDYEWEPVKKPGGRKVVAVRFIFDRRKIAAEREEKRKEEDTKRMRRAADIVRAASRCYAERSVLSADEQARRELHPEPEVCEYCKKSNLPIPNCQRFKRAEVVE